MPKKKSENKEEPSDTKNLKLEVEQLRKQLEQKQVEEAKEKDPMSGPGVLCEATKITNAEAWQLPMQERLSPISGTPEMISDPTPEGYVVKRGPNNSQYVVSPDSDELIPNCKSKYTKEYWVYTKKEAEHRGNFKKEPPKMDVHLCDHHAHIFQAHELKGKAKAR